MAKKKAITPLESASHTGKSLGVNKYTLPVSDGLSQRTPPVSSEIGRQADNFDNFKWGNKKPTKTGTTVIGPDGYTPKGYVRVLDEDGNHMTCGDGSHKLSNYELPVCETDKERRSFPGWCVVEPDMSVMSGVSEEGSTETRGGNKNNKAWTKYAMGRLVRRFE